MTDLPDGWTAAPGADGHTVASKFVDGHYETVEVPDGNDLAGTVAAVEAELQLRAQAQADERRKLAAELRAEADRVDPDVQPVAPAAPVEAAPVEESAPAEPASTLDPDPVPDAADAAPATEGA